MRNSLKLLYSGSIKLPSLYKINYNKLSIPTTLPYKGTDYLNIEIFTNKTSIFSEEYFSKIDFFSSYHNEFVIYDNTGIKMTGDKLETLLLKFLNKHIFHRISSKKEDYSSLLIKLNLLDAAYKYLSKNSKSSHDNALKLFCYVNIDPSYNPLYVYTQMAPLMSHSINDMLFLIEMAPSLHFSDLYTLVQTLRIESPGYYHKIYFFYRLAELFLKKKKIGLAAFYYGQTIMLIKDGANLEFRGYLQNKLKALIQKRNWKKVFTKINNILLNTEKRLFGISLNELYKHIPIEAEEPPQLISISVINRDSIYGDFHGMKYVPMGMFNNRKVYFTECVELEIKFSYNRNSEIVINRIGNIPVCRPLLNDKIEFFCKDSTRIDDMVIIYKGESYEYKFSEIILEKIKLSLKLVEEDSCLSLFKGENGIVSFKFVGYRIDDDPITNIMVSDGSVEITENGFMIWKEVNQSGELKADIQIGDSIYKKLELKYYINHKRLFSVISVTIVNNIKIFCIISEYSFKIKSSGKLYQIIENIPENIPLKENDEWVYKDRYGVICKNDLLIKM
ncbi:hypothetical protein TCON_1609 [Astathelohania contejeani]|uniref:Uncharacterized protein n=1 Tax=Astathelohania contejeani TaxID=164912 RepID=A0ABQ7HYJ0_9MICR|nr:hypothetical protein TCON_1609 [Thelohania contejeani]